jgi:hypothetical protein
MEQFPDTTSIQGASFSADESRLLFSSNKIGIWNAYTVPVAGGEWTAVTTSTKDSTYDVSFFENKEGFLPAGVSDDAKWVALAKANTTNNSLPGPAGQQFHDLRDCGRTGIWE